MTDEDFYGRVRNCNLIPSDVRGVWRTRDDQERRTVPTQAELALMDDDEREAFLKRLRSGLGLDPE
jgi:hypothetical protein